MATRTAFAATSLRVLSGCIHWLRRIADELAALICAFLIVATTAAVIVYQQGITIVWLDDLLRALLIWLVYIGSVSLCFDNDHIAMDAVYQKMPPPLRRLVDLVVALLGIGLCAYITKFGLDSMLQEVEYGTLLASGYLPSWPQTLAIPLCFALMTVAYLSYLVVLVTGRRRTRSDGEEATREGL
jgi:TRAP-type C4-dicarboxylate transport system permease small subunit